jgi:hypothetical protein
MTLKALVVSPYISSVRSGGAVVGYQVRFKRYERTGTKTISRYFAVSVFGSSGAALSEAEKWRRKNLPWLTDSTFEPVDNRREHPILAEVRRARQLSRSRPRTRKS